VSSAAAASTRAAAILFEAVWPDNRQVSGLIPDAAGAAVPGMAAIAGPDRR